MENNYYHVTLALRAAHFRGLVTVSVTDFDTIILHKMWYYNSRIAECGFNIDNSGS